MTQAGGATRLSRRRFLFPPMPSRQKHAASLETLYFKNNGIGDLKECESGTSDRNAKSTVTPSSRAQKE